MLTKTQIIDSLQNMPNKMTLDEFFDKMIFIDKVQSGLNDSKNGKTLTKEQAKKKLSKWLK
jgi:hypothetical protein